MHRNNGHELLPPSSMPYLSPVLVTPFPEGIFRRLFFFSVSLSLPPGVAVIALLFPKGSRVGALSLAAAWLGSSSPLETNKEPFDPCFYQPGAHRLVLVTLRFSCLSVRLTCPTVDERPCIIFTVTTNQAESTQPL